MRASHIPILGRIATWQQNRRIRALYESKDFLDAYSEHTDMRVDTNPHSAIGGMWEALGRAQFDFLVAMGLRPQHTLLDIGCGTLRAGRHFIGYLDAGHYTGMDISQRALDYARTLIADEGLEPKKPQLVLNEEKHLLFDCVAGRTFDVLLAHSVFTHLKPEHIEECFQNLHKVMSGTTTFYFTYRRADTYRQTNFKEFAYPPAYLEELAGRFGYVLEDCSDTYKHPKGGDSPQIMTALRPA